MAPTGPGNRSTQVWAPRYWLPCRRRRTRTQEEQTERRCRKLASHSTRGFRRKLDCTKAAAGKRGPKWNGLFICAGSEGGRVMILMQIGRSHNHHCLPSLTDQLRAARGPCIKCFFLLSHSQLGLPRPVRARRPHCNHGWRRAGDRRLSSRSPPSPLRRLVMTAAVAAIIHTLHSSHRECQVSCRPLGTSHA